MPRRVFFATVAILMSLTWLPTPGDDVQPPPPSSDRDGGFVVDRERGEGEMIRNRLEWFFSKRRPGSEGRMAEKRLEAVEFTRSRAALLEAEGAGTWTPRGPFSSNFGGWTFGKVSGRVAALAKDFSNGILYVGSASGGVWKSSNEGVSWTPIFDSAGTLTIGAIAVDPQNPSTLWVGTGENSAWCEDYFGIGLLRSTDGGTTWSIRNGSGTSTLKNLSTFASIVVHPSNSNRVIVGGQYRDCANGNGFSGGIYASDDGGATWTERLSSRAITEVVMDPSDPLVLWAGAANSGVYRSPDNGNTWTLQTGLPTGSVGRVEVAIAPSDPSTVYALFERASGTPQFWRTTNGGTSWTMMSSGSSACDGQCSYNMVMRVHPTNPATIYRGTIKAYRSTNGGTSWTDLTGSWGSSQKVHQDIHELLIDPSNPSVWYIGGDGGMWKTTNGGSSFTNINANLSMTQFYDIAAHPTDDNLIMGGSQDNSSLARSSSDTWELQQVTGDGFVCAFNPATPTTLYIAGYAFDHGSGHVPSVYRSTSGLWGPFTHITDVSNGITAGDRIAWVTPYTLDPSTPSTLFLGTHRVYRSTDTGSSWTQVGPADMTGGSGTVETIHVARADGNYVYAGTGSSRIWSSVDGGDNWSQISTGLPSGRSITDIETDPTDATRAFCTLSGFNTSHLYEWGGTSWAPRGSGLPNVPANSVFMRSATEMYVGADTGIFRSTDGGMTFVPYTSGLPEGLVVTDLEYSPGTGTLTAGTYGRGAWQNTLGTPSCILACTATAPATATVATIASFSSTATPGNCAGTPTFAWTFGDGGTSALQNPTHTYAATGIFPWSLTATVDGITCTKNGSITVTPPCSLSCTATAPASGQAAVVIAFASTATSSYCTGSPTFAWTFGDGGTSTLQNPSHAYAASGTYEWTLTAGMSGLTCVRTGSLSITPPCTVTCTATVPATGRVGVAVPFGSTATASYCTGSTTFAWTFGDGGTSALQNPGHIYAAPGTYPWKLTVTGGGLTCTQSGSIVISTVCSVQCSATVPVSGIAGSAIAFASTATPSNCTENPTYGWTFGDGGTSALQNPTHTYAAAGTYTWSLTVTVGGASCTKMRGITIGAACTLACTATVPATGTAGSATAFASTAIPSDCTGVPTFAWAFGDGGESALQNPTHTYAAAGAYDWTLTVTLEGLTCTKSGTMTIAPPCTLSCTANVPASGVAGSQIAFASAATPANCNGAPTFAWTFGDGGASALQNPTHTYAAAGAYDWTLTVTVEGLICTKAGTVTIAPPCTLSCTANVPATGVAGSQIAFASSAMPANCAGSPTFAWTFGDGGASALQNPAHTYAAAGAYDWTLTVTVEGFTCTKNGTVTIAPPCMLSCTATVPESGVAGSQIAFSSAADPADCNGAPTFAWIFGDGGASALPNPAHAYAAAGTYGWTLTVAVEGLTCTKNGTVTIAPPCTLSCTAAAPPNGIAGSQIAFSSAATPANCAGSPTFAWTFGDGGASALQNPAHAYAATGVYDWTLTVTVDGLTCTKAGTVTIAPPCTLSCTATVPEIGVAGLEIAFASSGTPANCTGAPTFAWTFGDGGASALQNPAHTYAAAGTYDWTLTVAFEGLTCTKNGTVTIAPRVPGDCDGDGAVSIGELQRVIGVFLSGQPPECGADCSGDGTLSIGEVQKVIAVFLGSAVGC